MFTPVRAGSGRGNGVTARRWAGLLQDLGHQVVWVDNEPADLLIALHARKSHTTVAEWRQQPVAGPVVLAMTGTDLYVDLPEDARAQASLERADRLVVLQPLALRRLPPHVRDKTRVILQSAEPIAAPALPVGMSLCCLAHVRGEKGVLDLARATQMLPNGSDVLVTLLGGVVDEAMGAELSGMTGERFSWPGEVDGATARAMLAAAQALVVPSLLEGGSNVVAEAIVQGVPVLASRVDGNVGMLGASYLGYFEPADPASLAACMQRFEREDAFRDVLRQQVQSLAPLYAPRREEAAWQSLLAEL